MNNFATILCGILCVLQNISGLEYNKQQRISASTDFLLHEGGDQSGHKRDNVATQSSGVQSQTYSNQNGGKRDYVAQFPALRPPSTPPSLPPVSNNLNSGPQRSPASSNGKRDYVAPTVKPYQQTGGYGHTQMSHGSQSGGKRDYVAQFPSLGPTSTSQSLPPASSNVNSGPQRSPPSSNGKRDYVAPQFPSLNPVQQSNQPTGGKVKDLINFYDSKTPSQGTNSYSSILQGSSNKNGPSSTVTSPSTRVPLPVTQSTLPTSAVLTPKPISFSSIVSGNKPNNPSNIPKPTTRIPSVPASHPGTPVLPSSIVNNNRGTGNTNKVTDAELETLSEELLRKDTNNAARYVTINYQQKTTSQSKEDKAPLPLLNVLPEVWSISTIQKFVPLLDNYERDTLVNEHVTPQERIEENTFIDAVMSTTVMRHLMTYLKNKGYVSPDPKQQRDFLKQIWFNLYSRGKGKIGSSAFEHVFVSELKNGDVSGLHNWIYFSREESANRVNYLGYLKYIELNDKGAVMKFHFNQQGVDKPVSSIFIGTSPELEMALYTLCFVTRADNDCKLKLANKDVNIITYTFRYRSKNLIGSAFPQI